VSELGNQAREKCARNLNQSQAKIPLREPNWGRNKTGMECCGEKGEEGRR